MCGITGFTGTKNDKQLQKMLMAIRHRGYDESISHSHNNFHIGMNRLTIKDLSTNLYPFSYQHFRMIYNGEIYNYLEIKRLLNKKGITFNTDCDGEIILPLFALLGAKAFSILQGMFAICIIDTKKNLLILARDKFGEKPLYYFHSKSLFVFGSEIKALLAHQKLHAQLNIHVLPEYLHHGSIAGDSTLIKHIIKVPSASHITVDSSNSISIQQYWHFSYLPNQHSLNYSLKSIEQQLVASVTSKLVADVPVGTFLSGGLDSSLISAIAAKHKPSIHTFSVSFPNFQHDNESRYAQLVSKHIGSHHHEIPFEGHTCLNIIESVASNIDEPIVDPAILPTFLISKEARKYVKVVLSGEGADEVFGGYYRYSKFLLKYYFSQLIPSLQLFSTMKSKLNHYSPQSVWLQTELDQLLKSKNTISNGLSKELQPISKSDPLLSVQLSDINHYLKDQLLMKIDKMSMLNNLEVRAPYLDSNLVEFVLNSPISYRFRFLQNKFLLKSIASHYLPASVVWRPKHGFSVPLHSWFNTILRDTLINSLEHLTRHHSNIFESKYIEETLKEHLNKSTNNTNKLWSLMLLSLWMKGNNVKSD